MQTFEGERGKVMFFLTIGNLQIVRNGIFGVFSSTCSMLANNILHYIPVKIWNY